MADDVTLPGTGDVVAADQAGDGSKVQLFKLAYAADGSRVLVPADGDGLAVKVQGLVSDARESYIDGTVKPLSITTDGRLRVSTSAAASYVEMFRGSGLFDVPDLTAVDDLWAVSDGSPWP